MRLAALAALSLGLLAQDLPPGVLLLSRIKRHVRDELAHLPDYACLQTALRYSKPSAAKGGFQLDDTVRLEVLFAGGKEMFSAPGSSSFRGENPQEISGPALWGDGAFGSFLQTLFVNDSGMFTWRGEEDLGGRRAVRYDYRVPVLLSGWEITTGLGKGTAGMTGSVWADPETLDLLRLEVNGDDIPWQVGVESVAVNVDYGRTRIGSRDVMLPQTGEVSMWHRSGHRSRNLLEFTHCRAFQAESILSFAQSTVRFDEPGSAPPGGSTVELPAGLTVNVKLAVAITEKSMVGDLVEGTVSGAVRARGRLWIPDGASVTGRIRRLYRNTGGSFTVGLEFTEVHAGDAVFRFFADLTEPDWRKDAALRPGAPMADLPGVGTLLLNGTRFTLPAGFRTVWKTRPLAKP